MGLRLDITPVNWLSAFLGANQSINTATYSVNSAQNQKYYQTVLDGNLNIQLPKLIFISSNFAYNKYQNNNLGFNQAVPLWGISTYKIFGKDKKSELRLTLNDALKKNLGINQNAYQNFVSTSVTQTLSRYFMLSYTYNMRGVKTGVKNNRWND